jgi:hypothetical protein
MRVRSAVWYFASTSTESGGICVSREVRDQLRIKGIVVFEDLGEHSMENIDHPVRAFRVRLDIPAGPSSRRPNPPPLIWLPSNSPFGER